MKPFSVLLYFDQYLSIVILRTQPTNMINRTSKHTQSRPFFWYYFYNIKDILNSEVLKITIVQNWRKVFKVNKPLIFFDIKGKVGRLPRKGMILIIKNKLALTILKLLMTWRLKKWMGINLLYVREIDWL